MKVSGERYSPRVEGVLLAGFDPFIAYEHWHRYRYAAPFVAAKTVLDIASGEGYGSAFLAGHATSVYGVDISEEAVQHSRRMYARDNLHFLQGSADAIPIPGQHCFDVIVSFETIEHLDAPTQERFASEVKRLLKPDGVLLISTPNRKIYTDAHNHTNPFHIHEYNKEEFIDFLKRYFKNISLYSQHVYPISYIWNLDGGRGSVAEYQMAFADGEFHPGEEDGKEAVYLIAVCADRGEHTAGPDSLLVDLTEVAFHGIPGHERRQTTSLFLDTGSGLRAEEVVQEAVEYTPEFTLEFALDPSTPVRQLRWDPLEARLCRVRLREVLWQDGEGHVARLDLGQVTSNGRRRDDGSFEFETIDPMIYFPISGPVARVTIIGGCEVDDVPATMAGLEQVLRSRTQALAMQDNVLQASRQQIAEQEQSIEGYRCRLALQDDELRAAQDQIAALEASIAGCRDQLAALEASIAGCRDQLAARDYDLQSARQRIAEREQSIAALDEQLQDRAGRIEQSERRMQELECALSHREELLRSIFRSKRWVVINAIHSALYSFLGLFRPTSRLRGGDRWPADLAPGRRPTPGRTPTPRLRSRSGRETPI